VIVHPENVLYDGEDDLEQEEFINCHSSIINCHFGGDQDTSCCRRANDK
jgi:hypothetical protein